MKKIVTNELFKVKNKKLSLNYDKKCSTFYSTKK